MALTPEQLAQATQAVQGGLIARPASGGATGGAPSTSTGPSNYGGANFGAGGGGENRYDYTQWGGGLYSIGIDPAKPNYYNDVKSWYDSQPANVRTEVDSYWKNNKRTGDAMFDLANAVDWRQRDVARKIQKEHGAFDFLGPLAPIGGALATAAGSILGGPIGGALAGGLAGGLGSKSVLGGLLGAAGGYFGGGLLNKVGIPTNTLGLPGGGTISGLWNNFAPGGALNDVNQFMPDWVQARAGGAPISSYTGAPGMIEDHAVQVATHTPPGVFEASKDLLSASINPSNIAGGIAKNIASNAITGLFSSPEAQAAGGGGMMGGAPGAWGVNPYTQSPYPALMAPRRMSIRNQLVG